MLLNTQTLSLIYIGFKKNFMTAFAGQADAKEYEKLATIVNSGTLMEEYGFISAMPSMREWLGARKVKSLSASKYQIRNRDFELTIGVDRNKIKDNQLAGFDVSFRDLGRSAALHPNQLLYELMRAGEEALCEDGKAFFAADHAESSKVDGVLTAGVVANLQTGSGDPWYLFDVSRELKPFIFQLREAAQFVSKDSPMDDNVFFKKEFIYGADYRANVGFGLWQSAFKSKAALSAENFDDAIAEMASRKNDEGETLGIRPNLLVCGYSNRAAAKVLLEAQLIGNGATNTNFKAVDLLVTPYLP